ncbi:ribosome maturation factor RimP [Bacillaceae bacterium S4-13-58]
MSQNVTDITEQLVTPILNQLNLELVDIEFVKEGKNWFLRVYVDKEGGIDIEECGLVNERLSEKLDEVDPISQPYFLEVSSPGVERPLKKPQDFEKQIGHNVHIKLYEHINGEKEFEGKLLKFEEGTVTVEIQIKARKNTVEIPYDKIAKARLAVTFH